MLRSGYSSEAILEDLKSRHLAETLNSEWEEQLRKDNASPALISALKSGNNAASHDEKVELKRFQEEQTAEAKRIVKETAEQELRAQQKQAIVVVPAQTGPDFKTPSEIEAEKRAAKIAEVAARKAYCEAHPVECETLEAIQSARGDAQRASGEARQARSELDSLKTSLWLQGVTPPP